MRAGLMAMGLALWLGVAPVMAQTVSSAAPDATAPAAAPVAAVTATQSADDVRTELSSLLRQYPPALRDVLRLSPSLAANADYLQPYPALAAFFAAHPEILRNPSFYLGTSYLGTARGAGDDTPATRRVRVASDMLDSAFTFFGLMTLLGVVAWIIRSLMDHQRWKRALRVQADAHAKVLERLSSTDDVLTYAQTPAGRQFLESGAPVEPARPALAAPIQRILWSVQMGMVIAVLGIGILVCAGSIDSGSELADVSSLLTMVGTVGVAVGVGFLLSAVVSYSPVTAAGPADRPGVSAWMTRRPWRSIGSPRRRSRRTSCSAWTRTRSACSISAPRGRSGRTCRVYPATDSAPTTCCRSRTYRFLKSGRLFESDEHQRHYLFRIATNLVLDDRRRPQLEFTALPGESEPGAPRTPGPDVSGLATAMARLKPRERSLLWLAYAHGASHDEIAEQTGLTSGSVKQLLFRARRRLAALLGGGR